MVADYEYIQKQTIAGKTIKVLLPEEKEERKIKEATSLVDKDLFEGSLVGDILTYEVYKDGHPEDVYGEYTVIPREMTELVKLQKDNAIAICIGDGVFMSLDEANQPWAGDVYTGLYNTNFAWQSTIHGIHTESTNVATQPFLSENDGKENTNKVLWMIHNNMYKEVDPILIMWTRNDLYIDVYNKLREANKYSWQVDANKIVQRGEEDKSMYLMHEAYKAFVYEAVAEGDYGLDTEALDYWFDAHDQKNANTAYVDNTSLLWKELVADSNYYINHNGDRIHITVEYEHSKVDDKMLGEVFVSDRIIYKPDTTLPIYSCSTNAFVYAQQYSTRGTVPGQWYLGSKEEMQNLMNYESITILNEMLTLLGRTIIDVNDAPNYLTSSQAWYNTNYCYTIYTHYRYAAAMDKRVVCHTRLVLNPEYVALVEEEENNTPN